MTDPSLAPVAIIMTSVGNDGFPQIFEAVKNNGEREVTVIGLDINPASAGLYLSDRGLLCPPRSRPEELVNFIISLAAEHKARLLFPLSTDDQEFYGENRKAFEQAGIEVIVPPLEAAHISNDKLELYNFARSAGIACPDFIEVSDLDGFRKAAARLGHPERPFVLKLNRGTGGQGVKVVHPHLDPLARMLDRNNREVTYDEVESWLSRIDPWPALHLTGYLPGREYSVDVLTRQGRVLSTVVRFRSATLYGLSLHGRVVDEPDVARVAHQAAQALNLSYVANIQVKRDHDGTPMLMEINPRIPGTIGLSIGAGVNMPYLAVKLALGEEFVPPQPVLGTVIMRYWNALYLAGERML